jgi:hypothetical protein
MSTKSKIKSSVKSRKRSPTPVNVGTVVSGTPRQVPYTGGAKYTKHQQIFRKLFRTDTKVSSGKPTRVSEAKETVVSPEDTEALSMAYSLSNPLSSYIFRLGGYAAINQVSGIIDTFFPADPSASGLNFPEWSTLTALFSNFRLIQLKVQFVRSFVSTVTTLGAPMICSNLGTAVAPGSYAAVADNADAKFWNGYSSTGNLGYTHVMKATDLNFSEVTTPTTTPYAGAPGSIQVYSNLGSTNVTPAYQCLITGIYEFRIRV